MVVDWRVRGDFWFYTSLPLEAIAEQIVSALNTSEPEWDAENVYEWFIVTTIDRVVLNFSRQHEDGVPMTSQPVRVMTAVEEIDVPGVGERIASTLGCRVYYGNVTYLDADDFEYHEQRHFDPA